MEHELESLLVRLTGDGSEYMKMLADAQASTVSATKAIEFNTKQIEGFSSGINEFAGTAVSALGALGAESFLRKSFGIFQDAETNITKLNAILGVNQREVNSTMAEYKAFAAEIAKITTLSGGAVLSMLRTAETFDHTGASAEQVVK